MLVGIDASRTTSVRRTGTENYSLYLIRELLSLCVGPRYRLYFNQAPPPGLFPAHAEQRVIPFPRLWTHARLSWEMVTRPPDVLFVPSHVLPLAHPRRCVVTVHDLGYLSYPEAHTRFQNVYLRWSTRYNARAATRILADSEATRQDLIRCLDTPPRKIRTVYPGRDESLRPVADPALLARVRAQWSLSERYLLYVGTLHPRKNLGRLVQAFCPLAAEDASLQLVLAGRKGWRAEGVEAEIRRCGLSQRVVLTGYVASADLPALMGGALAFVFPSLYEGFGMPVLEAMACGTPVVCSNASSLPEVVGDAALLVDPLDTRALSIALRRIVADADLRAALAERGLRQAQRFSWRQCAEKVLQVLAEAYDERS